MKAGTKEGRGANRGGGQISQLSLICRYSEGYSWVLVLWARERGGGGGGGGG